jgi:uroporphyrinogen-III synthase
MPPSETGSSRAEQALAGRTVLVTRPKEQAGELVRLLRAREARPLVAPAIELVPAPVRARDQAVRELSSGEFAWVLFTSRAGVEALAERMRALGMDGTAVRAKVAAIGAGTARALRAFGVEPDVVPRSFTTSALGRSLPRGTGKVLLARADIAPSELEGQVAAKGWTPVRVDAYRTRPVDRLPATAERALRGGRVDALTFTSASTVRGFLRMAGPLVRALVPRPSVVCIGPVTARAATDSGLQVDAVATPHTIEGLVAALERALDTPATGRESR